MPLHSELPDSVGEVVGGDGYMKHTEVLGESARVRSDVNGPASVSTAGGDLASGAPDPQKLGLLLPAVQAAREAARGDTADDDSFVFKTASANSAFDERTRTADDLTLETHASSIGDAVPDDLGMMSNDEWVHFAPDHGCGHGVDGIIGILVG